MKTRLIITYLFVNIFLGLSAQDIIGSWKGDLKVQSMSLPIIFHIFEKDDKLVSTMDSPAQGVKGFPMERTSYEGGNLLIEAPNLGIVCEGSFHNDSIKSVFKQGGMKFSLLLTRKSEKEKVLSRPQTPKPPFAYESEEVHIKNNVQGNVLAGTLCMPRKGKDYPMVVMITGSGRQNRDEEIFGHKPFLVLADYLAHEGIGSLRMDDRGVGGSEEGKPNATSADFATDIAAAVDFLAERGYTKIGLLGHSEGGMIAPMVACANKNVNFLVLLAAPGISVRELMISQNNAIGKAKGLAKSILEKNRVLNTEIYNFLAEKRRDKEEVESFLLDKFAKVYPKQLKKEQMSLMAKKQARAISSSWFQYFINFEPSDFLSKIKIPVLALNGDLDLNVSSAENLAGIEQNLKTAGNQHYVLKEFEGLNHLFQPAKTGLSVEYGQIEETISPQVLEIIATWVAGQ